jgi:hypothetical protein
VFFQRFIFAALRIWVVALDKSEAARRRAAACVFGAAFLVAFLYVMIIY